MPWKSLAENSDLRHNPAESRSPYLHPRKIKGRKLKRKKGHYLILLDSSSSCPSFTLQQTFRTSECFPVPYANLSGRQNQISDVHKV